MSIGRQIRRLREAAGLRATDLAERLGVDPSAVSNLENDRRGVKADEVGVIADFLGVSQLAILEPTHFWGGFRWRIARTVTRPLAETR